MKRKGAKGGGDVGQSGDVDEHETDETISAAGVTLDPTPLDQIPLAQSATEKADKVSVEGPVTIQPSYLFPQSAPQSTSFDHQSPYQSPYLSFSASDSIYQQPITIAEQQPSYHRPAASAGIHAPEPLSSFDFLELRNGLGSLELPMQGLNHGIIGHQPSQAAPGLAGGGNDALLSMLLGGPPLAPSGLRPDFDRSVAPLDSGIFIPGAQPAYTHRPSAAATTAPPPGFSRGPPVPVSGKPYHGVPSADGFRGPPPGYSAAPGLAPPSQHQQPSSTAAASQNESSSYDGFYTSKSGFTVRL